MKQKLPKISQTFARWLAVCALAAFTATAAVIWTVQTHVAENDANDLLRLNIRDVYQDIVDASNENLLALTHEIAGELAPAMQDVSAGLAQLADQYDISEINLVNENGIITATTNDLFLGYDMSTGQQSAEFLVLLEGQTEYAQSYQPVSYDASISRKYGGVALSWGGFVQVGYDAERFHQDILSQVIGVTRNRHVGENGCIIISDEAGLIVSDRNGGEGQSLEYCGLPLDLAELTGGVFTADVYGTPSYCMCQSVEGYYAISALPIEEVTRSRNISVAVTLLVEALIFAALFVLVYALLNKRIVSNIQSINGSLSKITGGDLDQRVDIRDTEEFASLSDDINTTVAALKQYITEAEQRIDKELEFAQTIQKAALPSVFPPYPNRNDFEIYACMDTAREVGGDFYDFYLLSDRTLAFLIADVSDKGIPAAMFMMQAKTLLKSLAESGMTVEQVLTRANDKLCQNNEANMFLTAWMGILDLETGLLQYSNAGHNPPALLRAGEDWEFLRSRPGLVLAGMEGIGYTSHQLQLHPGDVLYLYTDGVTEAADQYSELYGEPRLQAVLQKHKDRTPEDLCAAVLESVRNHAGTAPQSDDITMLALRYTAAAMPRELSISAVPENLERVTAFVEQELEQWDCPMKVLMQLNLAVEEIFMNIASYAYDPSIGPATIRVETSREPMEVTITFVDRGKPYDPLAQQDPDTTLSAEERDVGGLGIFLVKKTMDDIRYEYNQGKNILRIVKRW